MAAGYEELLICSICTDNYREPKILTCHHSFCKECLSRTPQAREEGRCFIKCPVCRVPTQLSDEGIASLPHSFFIQNLLDIKKSKSETEYQLCPEHKRELDMYCNDCECLVCGHCIFRNHKHHDAELIADCFDKNATEINKALQNVKQKLEAFETSLHMLEDLEISFIKESNEVEYQINIFANSIVHKINQFRDKLTDEVRTATQKKRNAIQQQRQAVVDVFTKLQASYSSVDKILSMGSKGKTLASKQQILKQLKMANEVFDVTLLKPVESFDVKFEPNLANPLEKLGTLKFTHLHKKFTAEGTALKYAHGLSNASFRVEVKKGEELAANLPISMVSVEMVPYAKIEVTPLALGGCEVTYVAIKECPHTLTVKIGGEDIVGSPFFVHILPLFQRVEVPLSQIRILSPRGLCVTKRGSVVVSEYPQEMINEHIHLQSSSGPMTTEKEHFSVLKNNGTKVDIECPFPSGIAATSDNHILVIDKRNACVRKYKVNDKEVARTTIGTGEFRYLSGLAISREGVVAVTEVNSASVHIFNPDLSYNTEIGGDYKTPFFHPTGVTFDSKGNMYVCDCGYNVIFKLDSEYNVLSKFGNKGTRESKLSKPMAISADCNDVLYVADTNRNRIAVFNKEGQFLTCFGNKGDISDLLNRPCGVAVDSNGRVYVSDTGNDRVVVYN